jgi:hypothetical protein
MPPMGSVGEGPHAFIDEYRDAEAARRYAEALAQRTTQSWTS